MTSFLFDRLIGPGLRLLDPEAAHGLTLRALAAGLAPRATDPDDPVLAMQLWGRDFANPVGLSAGFDKDAQVMAPMLALGFGFVEVGSITPRPQAGNPKPRIFRLPEDSAVINRLGFNSGGLEAAVERLKSYRAAPATGRATGAGDRAGDRARRHQPRQEQGQRRCGRRLCHRRRGPGAAGRLPGGQRLLAQHPRPARAAGARGTGGPARPRYGGAAGAGRRRCWLKIAPDLTEEDKQDIAAVCLAAGVAGIVATNTTIARPDGLRGAAKTEGGGLSGKPLFAASTAVLSDLYRLTEGRLPLIGVGGIASGADAYRKIRAGASLVQLYTALIYQGPALVARIKRELARLLRDDGFDSLSAAVGADHRYSG